MCTDSICLWYTREHQGSSAWTQEQIFYFHEKFNLNRDFSVTFQRLKHNSNNFISTLSAHTQYWIDDTLARTWTARVSGIAECGEFSKQARSHMLCADQPCRVSAHWYFDRPFSERSTNRWEIDWKQRRNVNEQCDLYFVLASASTFDASDQTTWVSKVRIERFSAKESVITELLPVRRSRSLLMLDRTQSLPPTYKVSVHILG